ncbi:mitochondrial glyco protein [Blyttiomyces helicus]|uniref:Mitochondrial glyco protein n=1 Tax=Blyttiomyces helicus TaxID=388810 RepID=A0A4V1IRM5_9FUNG|nr:mitochondrial glyco protein [Blyttiomyces helicus]|eukprot:RKO90577.1 mitochondrial glyco protein [Blyttiomyces helicus]
MFSRTICRLRPVASRVVATRAAVSQPLRSFSLSAPRLSHGSGDLDLAKKLDEERKFEIEQFQPLQNQGILTQGVWKLTEKAGEKEVTLSRSFGNEKINVLFTTDAMTDAQDLEDPEDDSERVVPVSVSIIVEKKAGAADHGALEISATIQDNSFFIDGVSFLPSVSIVNDNTAEGDWQRRGRYGGPVFSDLEETVQDQFHTFLEERGFDEELATFIAAYVESKEQKEYVGWLEQVSAFVAK